MLAAPVRTGMLGQSPAWPSSSGEMRRVATETGGDAASHLLCAKCGNHYLRPDRAVLGWTGGRLLRLSCAVCGWDCHQATELSDGLRPARLSR